MFCSNDLDWSPVMFFISSPRQSPCWFTCLVHSVRTAPSWFWARSLSWRTGDRSCRGTAVSLVHEALKSDVCSQCVMCVMGVVAASLRPWLSCATKETRRDVLSFRGKQTRRRSLSCSPPMRSVFHQRGTSSDGFVCVREMTGLFLCLTAVSQRRFISKTVSLSRPLARYWYYQDDFNAKC